MLLPEDSYDSLPSARTSKPTSNMPTRKKPAVNPSFPGLGLPAKSVATDGSIQVAKEKVNATKSRAIRAASAKPATAKTSRVADRVTEPSDEATSTREKASPSKGKGKVTPRLHGQTNSQQESSIESEQGPSSFAIVKGRPAKTKAGGTTRATGGKRKTKADAQADDQEESASRPAKKARFTKVSAPTQLKIAKSAPPKAVINHAPTTRLDIYVCGEGSAGELGLGNAKGVTDVKRPRLNPHLRAHEIGVVHLVTGGMHAAALTHDNKIMTWGVNDQGALGRDTHYEGGLQKIDNDGASDSSENSDDIGLNPREATPTAIPANVFPDGTVFTQLAAGDSCTFALTDDGQVYGWGTFRAHDGIMGFFGDKDVQRTPILIPGLKSITRIVCGANHAIALDEKGKVFIWGCGEQAQLGYRHVERTKLNGLKPAALRIKGKVKMVSIGSGSNHAFAVDDKRNVWTWGSNSFGQTGVRGGAGEDNAVIFAPEKMSTLHLEVDERVVKIAGGMHHSIAVTSSGRCLVWGRVDGHQIGIDVSELSGEDIIVDARNNPRILTKPTVLTEIQNAQFIAAGTDHNIALDGKYEAYSWGFSANYQTGLGTAEDVKKPIRIDNTATRGKKLTWAGAGGQYSMLAGPHVDS